MIPRSKDRRKDRIRGKDHKHTDRRPDGSIRSVLRGVAFGVEWAGRWQLLLIAAAVLLYFHLTSNIRPQLLYFSDSVASPWEPDRPYAFPYFHGSMAFFTDFLHSPGGLASYAGSFASQCLYYPLLGACILTAIAMCFCVVADVLVRALGGGRTLVLRFVPAMLLVVAFNRYRFNLGECIALLASTSCILLIVLLGKTSMRQVWRALLFVVCSAGLYFAAGAPFLLFVFACAWVEMAANRKWILGAAYLGIGAGLPLAGSFAFGMSFGESYARLCGLWPNWDDLNAVLMAAVAVFFVAIPVGCSLRPYGSRLADRMWSFTGRIGAYYREQKLGVVVSACVLVALAYFAALRTQDTDARWFLHLNYYARMGQWPDYIRQLAQSPRSGCTTPMLHDIYRGLYETGQMGDRMFAFPQRQDMLLPVGPSSLVCPGGPETLYAMGLVNESEHTAQEILEKKGYRPQLLYRVALANVVNDRPRAAAIFLTVLMGDVVLGRSAANLRDQLAADPSLSGNQEVEWARSHRVNNDVIAYSTEDRLLRLLARDAKNRMAFEYLMAYYMQGGGVAQVAANLSRLRSMGYRSIPEQYAEAALIYSTISGQAVDFQGYEVPPAVANRFSTLMQATRRLSTDPPATAKACAALLPGSYFNYYFTEFAKRYLKTPKAGSSQ